MLIKKIIVASLFCLVAPLTTANDLNTASKDKHKCDANKIIKGSIGADFDDQSDQDEEKYSVGVKWEPFNAWWKISDRTCLNWIVEFEGSDKRSFQLDTRTKTSRLDFYPLQWKRFITNPRKTDEKELDDLELSVKTGIGYVRRKEIEPMVPEDTNEDFVSLIRFGLEYPLGSEWSIEAFKVLRFDRFLSGRDSAQLGIKFIYKWEPEKE